MSRSLTIDGDQLRRLMRICSFIGGGRPATFQQLQRKTRASRRTLFRDFKELEKTGITVDLDQKGYRIRQKPSACRALIKSHQLQSVHKLLNACV